MDSYDLGYRDGVYVAGKSKRTFPIYLRFAHTIIRAWLRGTLGKDEPEYQRGFSDGLLGR